MSQRLDCLILGGGVIGLTLALELRLRGRSVRLLERGAVGREASWAGAGILPPPLVQHALDPLDQLRAFSHELHFELSQRLLQETGIDNGLHRCGGLYLAGSVGEAASVVGLQSLYTEHGVEATQVDSAELKRLEPALASAVDRGRIRLAIHCPAEAQLRNPRHLAALRAACLLHGVELSEAVEATSIRCKGGRVEAVATSQGELSADAVCVTSGAWSNTLLEPLGLQTGVFPVRGQMILYRCPRPPLTRILNEGPRYIVPRKDGHCLVGSCEEEAGFEKRTTAFVQASLEKFARELTPELSPERITDRWSGLRPASFDGFPYIGKVNEIGNLYIAVGHFRSGIHLSTGTARLLAQTICGEQVELELTAFSPNRG